MFMHYYEKYMSVIGSITSIMFYLQAYKIFANKSAKDVSGVGFLLSFIGLSSWLIYGILLKNKPLIVANIFGTVGVLITLCGIVLYGSFL
jgi:MtN3 and saliva related transmembrane protein